MMTYFIISSSGERQGPYTIEALQQMGITPDTLLWAKGLTQFVQAGQIPELQAYFFGTQQQAPYQETQNSTSGASSFQKFLTDSYESEDEIPALKRWVNTFLGWVDDGRFFREPLRVFYIVVGVLLALMPLWVLVMLVDDHGYESVFSMAPLPSIVVLLVSIVLGVFGLLFWINRSRKVKAFVRTGEDFVAIPLAAHFVQTAGEFVGICIGTAIPVLLILLALFYSDDMYALNSILPFHISSSFSAALVAAVGFMLLGFLIVILSHVVAEVYRALAAIANHTKRTAENTESSEA